MKTQIEIIRVHDILDEILNNPEVRSHIDFSNDKGDAQTNMLVIKRTLCWVLEHDGGRWLQNNMDSLTKELENLGFVLKNIQ